MPKAAALAFIRHHRTVVLLLKIACMLRRLGPFVVSVQRRSSAPKTCLAFEFHRRPNQQTLRSIVLASLSRLSRDPHAGTDVVAKNVALLWTLSGLADSGQFSFIAGSLAQPVPLCRPLSFSFCFIANSSSYGRILELRFVRSISSNTSRL